jgi:hypothetical protein
MVDIEAVSLILHDVGMPNQSNIMKFTEATKITINSPCHNQIIPTSEHSVDTKCFEQCEIL